MWGAKVSGERFKERAAAYAKQRRHDLLVHHQRSRQERRRRRAIGHHVHEAVAHQRRRWREPHPSQELLLGRLGEQTQRQVHGRPPPRHVVLQVGVHALVAEVELRRERDQQQVEVEVR